MNFLKNMLIFLAIVAAPPAYTDDDIASLTAAAEKGDAKAQYQLGYDYHYNIGTKKNDAVSLQWIQKSAEQNYTPAQYALGAIYVYGRGATRNVGEGLKWLNKAADAGNPNAQYSLASVYEHAELGVSQDHEKANALLMRSIGPMRTLANKGDFQAECNLGAAYQHGLGVDKDLPESFKWLLKSAENGYPTCAVYLGYSYKKGLGTAKNEKEAVKWFENAAQHGIDVAQYELAKNYIEGTGAPKNLTKAYVWLDIAMAQGMKVAGKAMMNIVAQMKPDEIKEALKLSHEWQAEHLVQAAGAS